MGIAYGWKKIVALGTQAYLSLQLRFSDMASYHRQHDLHRVEQLLWQSSECSQ